MCNVHLCSCAGVLCSSSTWAAQYETWLLDKLTLIDVVFAFLFPPLLIQLSPARMLPKAVRGAFTLMNNNTVNTNICTAALLRLHLVLLPSARTDNSHESACMYYAPSH